MSARPSGGYRPTHSIRREYFSRRPAGLQLRPLRHAFLNSLSSTIYTLPAGHCGQREEPFGSDGNNVVRGNA